MGASGPPNFRANRWLAPRGVHRRHRDRGFESGFLQRRVCKPAVQNWGNLLAGLSLFSFRVWHPVSGWISRSPEIVNLRSNSQSRLKHKARHRSGIGSCISGAKRGGICRLDIRPSYNLQRLGYSLGVGSSQVSCAARARRSVTSSSLTWWKSR